MADTRPAQTLPPAAVGSGNSPAVVNAPPQASQVSGGQELTIAQSYLNGTGGKERNGDEAIRWLWKSVAKQNGAAALLLSDLYLKGEDVAKNCEQARLLLGAAARKHIAGADERLRNLQSFGCE